MSDSPKIDEAFAKAMYNQRFNQLAGEPQWDDISQLVVTRAIWLEKALTVRAMLLRAGFSIQSERAALDEFQAMVAKGSPSACRLTGWW